ncbi:hypothetical protein D0Z07_9214 [Hyphodiscus hymeniophilus]|uniref:Uncharacterized protein n=1 Tax=Hyphodiscus hymeniophilus TaxID=353542 RepID=A0A9P6SL19_9HELO|nr:hypothetical protein D0Z07_9214 [Hyphodiscus hymeniophilus]
MPGDDMAEQGRDTNVDVVRAVVLEDVSAAEDASQVIVSTHNNPISATRVSAETRAVQWTGQMAEASIQQLSRDRGNGLQTISEPQRQTTTSFGAHGPGRTVPNKLEEPLRQVQFSLSPVLSDEIIAEREQLQEERQSTKRCLAICAEASEHLREFEESLQIYSSPSISDEVTVERELLQEEKESTEQCLATCTNALEHIAQLQSNLSEDFPRDIINISGGLMSAQQATANTLQECKDNLTSITVALKGYIQGINSRTQALLAGNVKIPGADSTIRTNTFEDVSIAQDIHEVIVSPETLISATRVTAGIEGRQWLGQMSDGTLQRLRWYRGSGRVAQ